MSGLAAPDASVPEKIASFALPLAAGMAAAIHPAGARGLAGLTSAVQNQLAVREFGRREAADRQLGMKLSDLLQGPSGEQIPTGREVPDYTSPGAQNVMGTPEAQLPQPTKPEMRPQLLSERLGAPTTAFIRSLLTTPGMAREGATILGQQLVPKQSYQTVGEGQVLIDAATGRVVARGPEKYHPPTTVGPGQGVVPPGQNQPAYVMPDKPITMSPGQKLVDPNDRTVIGGIPDRPVAVSPGQQLLDPNTGQRVGGVPERPIVVAPGSSVYDPASGAVLFTAKDRPMQIAPGGAIVDPNTNQKMFQLPESPKNGIVIKEMGPDGKERQILVDPITATRRGEFGAEPGQTKVSDANTLRNQFLHQSTTMAQIRDAYNAIEKVGQAKPTAFGDMSLLYSYIKLLDPNSAVREGEYATANNAQSVPEAVRTLYNRAIAGQLLTTVRRRDIVGQARNIAAARVQSHEQVESEFKRIAQDQGFQPDVVVPDVIGDMRGRVKGPAPLVAATKDEWAKARRDARGDPMRTNQLLQQRGFDPRLDAIESK